MKKANGVSRRTIFVLRDADALGLHLEEVNGKVKIRSMSMPGVGGASPGDVIICSSLEALLSDFISSSRNSLLVDFLPGTEINHVLPSSSKFARKGDNLSRRGKFFEASATYALVEEEDPLVLSNRCISLQLSNRIDEASVEANKIIQKHPSWEMGYVRKAACQAALNDFHGAVRTLTQGLAQIPESAVLLRRLQILIPDKEDELACLGVEEDTIISVFKQDFFRRRNSGTLFAPLTPDGQGLIVTSAFQPLIPTQSTALEVNGIPASSTRFEELRSRFVSEVQVIVIIWRVPASQPVGGPVNLARASTELYQPRGSLLTSPAVAKLVDIAQSPPPAEFDEKQFAIRLSAVPLASDQVIVFGAGETKCNGDYYPQGTRHERPWFENEYGICLSFEQGESGQCGWILGDPNARVIFYVLHPGHEPRGEDFGQWLPVGNALNPAPSFVGVGEKVASLKRLTLWVKDPRLRSPTMTSLYKTMIPSLLSLKGHAIRLYEGGWVKESIPVFELVIDQAVALAVGDERCPSEELSRIAQSARHFKNLALAEIDRAPSDPKDTNFERLARGFTVNFFEDQSRQLEIKVDEGLQSLVITDHNRIVSPRTNGGKASGRRSFGFASLFGCMRVPSVDSIRTPTQTMEKADMETWRRSDVQLDIVPTATGRMMRITNNVKTWETTLPDEDVFELLRRWITSGNGLQSPGEKYLEELTSFQ